MQVRLQVRYYREKKRVPCRWMATVYYSLLCRHVVPAEVAYLDVTLVSLREVDSR